MCEPCLNAAALYKWSKIMMYLEKQWDEVTVTTWFENAVLVKFSEEVLRIYVPSEFQRDVIQRRCVHHIQDALKVLFGIYAVVEVFTSDPI